MSNAPVIAEPIVISKFWKSRDHAEHVRVEIARMGRRAKAAKHPRLRRLAREAKAEARRLSQEGPQ